MNRTWKDAACEVAWNKIKKHGLEMGVEHPAWLFGLGIHDDGIPIEYDFTAFRAAFMKWLDENEVKK